MNDRYLIARMRQHRIDATVVGQFVIHHRDIAERLAELIPAESGERYVVEHIHPQPNSGLDKYAIRRQQEYQGNWEDDVWLSQTEVRDLATAHALDPAFDLVATFVANLRKRDESFQGSLGCNLQEEHEVTQALNVAENLLSKLQPRK